MTGYFQYKDYCMLKVGDVVYPNVHFTWSSGRAPEFSGVFLTKFRNSRNWMGRVVRASQYEELFEIPGLTGEEKKKWLGKWFDNMREAEGLIVYIEEVSLESIAYPPDCEKSRKLGVEVRDVILKINYGLRITGLSKSGPAAAFAEIIELPVDADGNPLPLEEG